jgi:hypothetical protein
MLNSYDPNRVLGGRVRDEIENPVITIEGMHAPNDSLKASYACSVLPLTSLTKVSGGLSAEFLLVHLDCNNGSDGECQLLQCTNMDPSTE